MRSQNSRFPLLTTLRKRLHFKVSLLRCSETLLWKLRYQISLLGCWRFPFEAPQIYWFLQKPSLKFIHYFACSSPLVGEDLSSMEFHLSRESKLGNIKSYFSFVGPPRTLPPSLFLKKTSFTLLGCQELVNPNFRSSLFICLLFFTQNLFLSQSNIV